MDKFNWRLAGEATLLVLILINTYWLSGIARQVDTVESRMQSRDDKETERLKQANALRERQVIVEADLLSTLEHCLDRAKKIKKGE
jgi:hypothetical protein